MVAPTLPQVFVQQFGPLGGERLLVLGLYEVYWGHALYGMGELPAPGTELPHVGGTAGTEQQAVSLTVVLRLPSTGFVLLGHLNATGVLLLTTVLLHVAKQQVWKVRLVLFAVAGLGSVPGLHTKALAHVPAATTVVMVLSMLLAGLVSLRADTIAVLVKLPGLLATTSALMSQMLPTGISLG